VSNPAQNLRKEELLAALAAVKQVAAGERTEAKELKGYYAQLETKKKELDERRAKTAATYGEIVAELKSLS
jgi:hypothetical protein